MVGGWRGGQGTHVPVFPSWCMIRALLWLLVGWIDLIFRPRLCGVHTAWLDGPHWGRTGRTNWRTELRLPDGQLQVQSAMRAFIPWGKIGHASISFLLLCLFFLNVNESPWVFFLPFPVLRWHPYDPAPEWLGTWRGQRIVKCSAEFPYSTIAYRSGMAIPASFYNSQEIPPWSFFSTILRLYYLKVLFNLIILVSLSDKEKIHYTCEWK